MQARGHLCLLGLLAFLLFASIAGFLPARLYAQSRSGEVLRQMDRTREEIELQKWEEPGKPKPLIIENEKKEPAANATNAKGEINKDQK